MPSSRRVVALAGLALALLVSLAGCVHEDRNVVLQSNGSGTYTLALGFSEQLVSLAGDNLVTQMNDCGAKIKAQGGSYRHYDDTGYSYWAFTWRFNSVAGLNQLLRNSAQVCDTGSTTGLPTTAAPSDTFTVAEQAGLLTNTFHATGHMSMVLPAGDTGGLGQDAGSYLKDARESFAITMPGWVTSHKGGTLSGNTVTYTVHIGETADIDVVGGAVNTPVVLAFGGALAAILLLGIVLTLVLRRRKAASRVPAPASVPVASGFGVSYPENSPVVPESGSSYPAVPPTLPGQIDHPGGAPTLP